jgi:hypothetical protein
VRRLLQFLTLGWAAVAAPQPDRRLSALAEPSRAPPIPPAKYWWYSAVYKVGAPANQPWAALLHLGLIDRVHLERLAREDPISFLETCILRYQVTVRGYRCILEKEELVKGGRKKETVQVCLREKPLSVLMCWPNEPRPAYCALYVAGENDGKMLVRPRRLWFLPYPHLDPDGARARASSRYTIRDCGILSASERALAAWQEAKRRGRLNVRYEGKRKVPEVGGRWCYVLRRHAFDRPEADGVTGQTIYVDVETLLQLGSVETGDGEELIGKYYFRDVELNPAFPPAQFSEEALKR